MICLNSIHTFVVLAYKESEYLEECIKSVLDQSIKTNVVIATSTSNDYIKKIAKKYKLDIIVNDGPKGIGYDFDFAINCVDSELVTVAHQDDIYEYNYAKTIIEKYKKNRDSLIVFSDYFEIKNNNRVYTNKNLKIKRLLLSPLRINCFSKCKFIKRMVLSFGCPICCPAVTFVKKNIDKIVFSSDLKCNVDWNAWEKLSKKIGRFSFCNEKLMGHRVHDDSTTTEILKENIRTKEDYAILCRFWPKFIAKVINKFYKNAEKSNFT